MHEKLIQQLIQHFGSLKNVPEELKPFLEEVNRTYANGPIQQAAHVKTSRSLAGQYTAGKQGSDGTAHPGSELAIPIELRGETLGALNLSFDDGKAAQEVAPLLQQLSGRLALAMDNARLFSETQAALTRTNALLAVSRAAIASESITDLLEETSRVIYETLNCDRVVIRRIDTASKQIREAVGSGPGVHHSPLDLPFSELMDGLHGWVLNEKQPAISPKDQPDPRDSENTRQLRILANCGSILIVPLLTRDAVIGMITAINTPDQRNFDEQDEELVVAMANQITTALENAQLVEEQQNRLHELSVLFEGSRIFSTAPVDLKEAATVVSKYFLETSGADSSAVGLFRQEEDAIHFLAETTFKEGSVSVTEDPAVLNYTLDSYPFTRASLNRREAATISISDPDISPAEKRFLEVTRSKTLVVIPMASKGQPIGVIELKYEHVERSIDPGQLTYFTTLANQAAATLDNLQLLSTQRQRAIELQTAAEVSQAASSILDPEELLPHTVELIRDRFDLYYAGIFLVDESGDWAILRAGSGEAGRIQIEQHHMLRVGGQSMIGRCIETGEPQIAFDVGEAAVHFDNPVLPDTRSEMALPLISRGERLGAMTIQSTAPAAFTEENIITLRTMADQLANAIENARLYAQAQLQNVQLNRLNEMGRELTAQLDRDAIVHTVHRYTQDLLEFNSFLITFLDKENDRLQFPLVVENGESLAIPDQPLGSGLVAHIIRTRAPLLIPEDLEETTRKLGITYTTVGQTTESWLGVPLYAGDEVVGVISVQSTTTPGLYTERHRDLLISIANQAANALQITALFEQAQQQTDELALLNEMSRELSIQLDVNLVVDNVYTYATRLLATQNLFIALFDEETETIEFVLAVTDEGERLDVPSRKLGSGLTDYVIQSRQPLLFKDNAEAEIERMGLEGITIGDPPLSWLAVPIVLGDTVIGVIGTQSVKTAGKFTERHRDLLQSIAGQAAIALQNASLFSEAQQQSDDLAVLNEMSRHMSTLLDAEQIVESIYEYSARLINTPDVFIALYNRETDRIRFPYVVDDSKRIEVPPRLMGQGLTDHVIRSGEPLIIQENANQVIEEMGIESVLIGDPPQSWLGVPILLGDEPLGMIGSQNVHTPRRYTPRQIGLITSIAGQAAIALQNARLFNQAQRQNEELLILNEMSRRLATQVDIQEIVETIYEYTGMLLDASNFYIAFYDEERQLLEFPLATIGSDGERIDLDPRPLQNGLTDYIVRSQSPLLLKRYDPKDFEELGVDLMTFGDEKPAQSWLGVPMLAGGRTLGVISVQSTEQPGLYTERHRDLLTAIANQAVSAIQNARSFSQAQQQTQELAVLNEMSRELTTLLDVQKVVETVYTFTSRLMDTTSFFVAFYDAGADLITFPLVYTGGERYDGLEPRALGSGITDHVLRNAEPVLLSTFSEEALKEMGIDLILFGDDKPAESWLGVPMLIGDRLLGAIVVQSTTTPGLYTARHRDLLTAIANQAAIAIQNARLFGETQKRAAQLLTAAEVARDSSESLNLDELLPRAVNLIRDRFGFYHASIFLLDESGENAYVRASTGEAGKEMLARRHSLAVGSRSIVGSVTHTGEPLVINDVTRDLIHRPNPLLPDTRAELGIPLKVGERVIGALDVQSTEINAFTPDDVAVLETLSDQIAVAVDNAMLYEEQLETAEQLRELDQLKNQFLANMSHELRTPLNSIIGFSRVILKGIDGPVTDMQQQDLTAIYNAGQHLLGLINDILDLSRIEAGKMELNFEDLELEPLITSVMATARGLVKEKDIVLEQEIPENLPHVYADSTRIRQILLNLLQNAAKFTEQGSIRVTAAVEEHADGSPFVRVSVTDTGIGIAPEDQERLFQPFTQVDSSTTRKVGGTGLGLSISRNLIDLHGGEIWVESEPDKGSTFHFTLPAFTPAIQKDVPEGKKAVLAIDDDPAVTEQYERYLESNGFHVISLSDPDRAVETALRIQPFAITVDLDMPGKNGWRVIRDLKAHDATRHIPVIFCTMVDDQARGFILRASDYLLRPLQLEDLKDALVHIEANRDIGTILVIDDEPEMLETIDAYLKQVGRYRVIPAESARRGIKLLKGNQVDVVMLDLMMEDLDGFKIVERMQGDKKFRDIPIVVIAGFDETTEAGRETEDGNEPGSRRDRLTEKIAAILRNNNGNTSAGKTHEPSGDGKQST